MRDLFGTDKFKHKEMLTMRYESDSSIMLGIVLLAILFWAIVIASFVVIF